MSNIPPLVARLIGIDNYSNYKHIRAEAGVNAENLRGFLQAELFKGDHQDIQSYKDATRDTIITQLSSLQKTFERTKAILFFFSGIGGRARGGTSIICPADIGVEAKGTPGITVQELVQLFDKISRARGNNITFFLDCPSTAFDWGNPSSFVVVAPRKLDPSNRAMFTSSIIDVLHSEIELNGSIGLLTVQSFAEKLHAVMPDIDVDCYGQNVDRLLFNPVAGRAHYAFISGKAEKDGSFVLLAGRAHGIQKGAIYGIYGSHVATDQNKRLGYLSVYSVKDATRALLHGLLPDSNFPFEPSLPNFYVPPVFYAVETYCPHETVDVFPGDNIVRIQSPSWKEANKEKANITLKSSDNKVEFLWNGLAEPSTRVETGPGNNLSVPRDSQELIKAMRRAARFTYYVGSFPDSLSSPLFGVELKEFDEDAEEPSGKDLASNKGSVVLNITQRSRALCLVIRNRANVSIWPFVFICEPRDFSILPWYIPTKALGAKADLIVGKGDDGLTFDWRSESKIDLVYIKIFVTKKPTSFSFLQQNGVAPEDELRELGQGTTAPFDGSDRSGNVPPGTTESSANWPMNEKEASWDTMQITIKRTYEPEERGDNHRDRLPFRLRQLGLRR